VIAPILTRGDDLVRQTIFYPIEMMAKRREGVSLQVQVTGDEYKSKDYGVVSTLDSSAILNGMELSVFMVNRDTSQPLEVTVDLSDQTIGKLLNAEIVHGTDPNATNTFDNPNRIIAQAFDGISVKDGKALCMLPPLSFCAATFRLV
jgi:alpha-L-arabinofuranosidase